MTGTNLKGDKTIIKRSIYQPLRDTVKETINRLPWKRFEEKEEKTTAAAVGTEKQRGFLRK